MSRTQPQAFVALPPDAGEPELRAVIEAALDRHKVRATAVDADQSMAPTVQDLLRESDLLIADVTGTNPNVMFEVGMALGMGKRVVLLSRERSERRPFDLRTQQVAIYSDVTSVGRYLDLWLPDALAEQASA